MNPEIQQHLIDYLDKLDALAKQGADFAADQIPLVLQEYILYSRASSTWKVVVGVAMLITGVACLRSCIKYITTTPERDFTPEKFVPYLLLTCVFGFFGTAIVATNLDYCIKAWVAPRVVLIEKLNELRK